MHLVIFFSVIILASKCSLGRFSYTNPNHRNMQGKKTDITRIQIKYT